MTSPSRTDHGFKFGAASVTACMSDKRGVVIEIETPRGLLQVYVTPTGKMRVGDEKGREWKP